ncbi:transposase [Streptomyces parvus]|uniref:transposase n=1 Tax=Streptomyces TaxID=1883 RepID=UPI003316FA24
MSPERDAIPQARTAQDTDDWKESYATRVGIGGTIAQAVHTTGLRRCRYRGLAKTRLQSQLTATAINLARVDAWTSNRSQARTRTSHLAALAPPRSRRGQ